MTGGILTRGILTRGMTSVHPWPYLSDQCPFRPEKNCCRERQTDKRPHYRIVDRNSRKPNNADVNLD